MLCGVEVDGVDVFVGVVVCVEFGVVGVGFCGLL